VFSNGHFGQKYWLFWSEIKRVLLPYNGHFRKNGNFGNHFIFRQHLGLPGQKGQSRHQRCAITDFIFDLAFSVAKRQNKKQPKGCEMGKKPQPIGCDFFRFFLDFFLFKY